MSTPLTLGLTPQFRSYLGTAAPTRLSNDAFAAIFTRVPRINIDDIIYRYVAEGPQILLSRRSIEPNKGLWQLPGGTVYKDEDINDAAVRIGKAETGLTIKVEGCAGVMSFPAERRLVNLDGTPTEITVHTNSLAMLSRSLGGELRADTNTSETSWLHDLPENNVIPQHAQLLRYIFTALHYRKPVKTVMMVGPKETGIAPVESETLGLYYP
jgi:ADP-ribose pyrophosphatase YjhB (NUDIX family)